MQSNSPRQLAGMLALAALLALGLAGCGGDEPAPVTAPAPAPAPAPPPFEPQSVEVALGSSGENVTLMTTEGGGFTLNGETVASGAEVMTEGGATYTLTLADGAWSAAFMPMAIEIPLGMSGDSVTVMTAEGGGVTLDGEPVTADTRVMADNGATYQARAPLPDGTLGAVYVPDTATVALGMHGGSVTLSLQEDRATWTDAGGAAVASGTMVMGNGRSYTLTLDGMEWSAAYDAVTATVALGASGASAVLTQAEDGSWWLGGGAFASGGTTTAGGNAYVLTLAGGVWSAAYSPSSMPIAGTGLTAVMNEDGSGYDVAGATLPASGMGDITVDGRMFRVWMMDGALMGARYDLQRHDDTDRAVGDLGAVMAHLTDDADTDANEALTKLRLEGHSGTLEFPFGELLDGGSSSVTSHNFVAEARKRIAKIHADVDTLLGLGDVLPNLNSILDDSWMDVRAALTAAFGEDPLPSGTPDDDEILGELSDILDALHTADNLAAAAMKDGDGVLEMLELSADKAAEQFAAHRSEATASFGVAGATRYGTVVETTRENAAADAKLQQTFTHRLVGVGSFNEPKQTTPAGNATDELLIGFDKDGNEVGGTTMTPELEAALAELASYSEPTDAQIAEALQQAISDVYTGEGEVVVKNRGNEMDGGYSIVPDKDYYRYRIELDGEFDAVVYYKVKTEVARMGTLGAFGYSTMDDTNRTRYIQTQGNARYMGGTHAVDAMGEMYAGVIDLQVRFRSERVSGVVSELVSMDDGEAWTYQFGEVESIILPDADLLTRARWSEMDDTARVTFAVRAGSPSPQDIPNSTFEGILSGTGDAAAGMYASGTWSTGQRGRGDYLAGGFGAVRTEDTDPAVGGPEPDDGSTVTTMVTGPSTLDELKDGMLKVKLTMPGPTSNSIRHTFDPEDTMSTVNVSLATLHSSSGQVHNQNGTKYTDLARTKLEELHSNLAILQSVSDAARQSTVEAALWGEFKKIVAGADGNGTNPGLLFNMLGDEIPDTYDPDEALGLIQRSIDALEDADALEGALGDGGVFEGATTVIDYSAMLNRRDFQVKATMGTTNSDFTRFGVWWARGAKKAQTGYNQRRFPGGLTGNTDWAGNFAYSQLPQTSYVSHNDPSYPAGGNATYRGETIAMQRTYDPDDATASLQNVMTYYSGDVEANITWASNSVGAAGSDQMHLVFSDLEDMSTGDPLTGTGRPTGRAIREIVIAGLMVDRDASGKLSFKHDVGSAPGTSLRLVYADRNVSPTEEVLTWHPTNGLDVDGRFVGKGIDGPLGVIGTWGVEDGLVGSGKPLLGAFGAELAP